ncbi:MAG: hypothetical protein IJU86_02945 [Firmicutes bacterium]|nr:hypothetical protein [Bacillota bacterium]
MNSIKKINLLFCLVLSFVFLLGNVFSVQAESIQKQQTLQQCIDPKEYPNEIAECIVYYRVKNDANGKIIWTIGQREFRMAKKPLYQSKNDYTFGPSKFEISRDRKTAKIFVTVSRDGFGFWNGKEEFNLTFELKVN